MGRNPFVNEVVIEDRWHLLQIIVMSMFVPFRLGLLAVCFFLVYLAACLVYLIDNDMNKPLTGIRKCLKNIACTLIVFGLRVAANFRININGHMAPPEEAPIMVLAPHSTFFDCLPHCILGGPSSAGKKSLLDAPILGKILRLTIPVDVDRLDKGARKNAQALIEIRAQKIMAGEKIDGEKWPQLAIFAEGTCTNRTQLINFRKGAFYPRLPVQPVCYNWKRVSPRDNISWTWYGSSWFKLLWLTLCNVRNELEITFLPVYVPNAEERNDVVLFANNVRAKMAEYLQIPVSEFTLEDVDYVLPDRRPNLRRLCSLLSDLEIEIDHSSHQVTELQSEYHLFLKHCQRNLIDRINDTEFDFFFVTFNEFAIVLSKPADYKLRRLFNMFNWRCDEKIDIREYFVAKYATVGQFDKEYFDTTLNVFKNDNENVLDLDSFIKLVRFPLELSIVDCKSLYEILQPSSNITYGNITKYLCNYDSKIANKLR